MALDAIPDRRRMDCPLQVCGVHVGMAGDTQRLGRGRLKLDPRDIFIDSNFVAAGATCLNRRVDNLSFGLVLVALNTLCGVGILVQWHGVNSSKCKS